MLDGCMYRVAPPLGSLPLSAGSQSQGRGWAGPLAAPEPALPSHFLCTTSWSFRGCGELRVAECFHISQRARFTDHLPQVRPRLTLQSAASMGPCRWTRATTSRCSPRWDGAGGYADPRPPAPVIPDLRVRVQAARPLPPGTQVGGLPKQGIPVPRDACASRAVPSPCIPPHHLP